MRFPIETQKECVFVLGERLTPEEAAELGHALVSASLRAAHGDVLRQATLMTPPVVRALSRQADEIERERQARWEGKRDDE